MADEKITIDDLAGMIKRSFDEVHKKLDKLDENDKIIMTKLEGIVYRKEFEELKLRVETIEEALAIKKKT